VSLQNPVLRRHLRDVSEGVRRTCKLDSELVLLREELYRRIASELHDSTCQHLIAASLGVMQARNALGNPAKAEQHCEQVDVSISRALKELRSLAYLLHPQGLFEGGLKTTIERYAEGFAARTGLVVDASISPAVDNLSHQKQKSLMRIVQEALTNVYRHARATRVDITIEAKQYQLQLEVRDDVQCIMAGDGARQWPALGTGLRIMQARLEEMHGRLEILSVPTAVGQGTILRAELPACVWDRAGRRRRALKKNC